MTEFIDIHVRKIHGGQVESSSPTRPSEEQSGGDEATTSSSLRGCPECGEELRMAAIIKHCKVKHKVKQYLFESNRMSIYMYVCLSVAKDLANR